MIVIPMAGLSERFRRAGYDQSKWKLPLAGRPLLDWTLLSFEHLFAKEHFVICHLAGSDNEAFIRERIGAIGIAEATLVQLEQPTRGQAETVALALKKASVQPEEAVTIFNVDTLRPKCRISELKAGSSGYVECFRGEGDHWSFVVPSNSKEGFATQVIEKVRVSDLCSTGLYVFDDAEVFFKAYQAEVCNPSSSELFVAPLYQKIIEAGGSVEYVLIDRDDVIFAGTPSEYEEALKTEWFIPSRFA